MVVVLARQLDALLFLDLMVVVLLARQLDVFSLQ